MTRYRCILLFLLCLLPATSYCQVLDRDLFCGKKWYEDMLKNDDGTIQGPEKGGENDYMQFNCDSTFELKESGIDLKGSWAFDVATRTITLIQEQIATMPEKISFHIVDFDEGHLVLIGQEGTDNESTAHLYTK